MPQVMVQTGSGGVDHSVIFLPHFRPVISKYMYLRNNQSAHVLVTTSCRILCSQTLQSVAASEFIHDEALITNEEFPSAKSRTFRTEKG